MTAEAIEFATANTEYSITPLRFGLLEVLRGPRDPFCPPEMVTTGVQRLLVDDVTVHPDWNGGSVLEARKVVFWRDGQPVLATSGGDSRAYILLRWGSHEELDEALRQIGTRCRHCL